LALPAAFFVHPGETTWIFLLHACPIFLLSERHKMPVHEYILSK